MSAIVGSCIYMNEVSVLNPNTTSGGTYTLSSSNPRTIVAKSPETCMASPHNPDGAIWKSSWRDVVMSLMLTDTADAIAALKARSRSTAESYVEWSAKDQHTGAP